MQKRDVFGAFLSSYLIIAIIATIGSSLIILTAVYRLRNRNYYPCLASMCAFALSAGLLALPCMIAAVAERSIIARQGGGRHFCQVVGALSGFLHRASTSGLCVAYVDRYILIWKPFVYKPAQRSTFCLVALSSNALIAAVFAISPFLVAGPEDWAYVPLYNTPLCMFVPTTDVGRVLLYVDTVYSYGIIWLIMCTTSVGMLIIACISAISKSKVVPISLGTFSKKAATGRQPRVSTAWCTKASGEPVPSILKGGSKTSFNFDDKPSCSRLSGKYSRNKEFPLLVKQAPPALPGSRKRKISPGFRHDEKDQDWEFAEPQRKKSIVAANLLFCDEVTLNKDGTTKWKSTTLASTSDRKSIPFSVQRELTLEQLSTGDDLGSRKVVFSSKLKQSKGKESRDTATKKRVSIRNPPFSRISSFRRKNGRPGVLSQLNTKALINLTMTLFVFTAFTIPVMILHFDIAATMDGSQSYSNFVLEATSSIAIASAYFTFPLMNIMADKDVKNTIVQIFKRMCDGYDFNSDMAQSPDSLDY